MWIYSRFFEFQYFVSISIVFFEDPYQAQVQYLVVLLVVLLVLVLLINGLRFPSAIKVSVNSPKPFLSFSSHGESWSETSKRSSHNFMENKK